MSDPSQAQSSQAASGGSSSREIVEAVLAAARPQPGLRWLDIGCGRGELLRLVRERWQPAELRGSDALDWLADDLRGDVAFTLAPAESSEDLQPADRVLLVEVIEHLEAPWQVLRAAAELVLPGGRIVVSTPNLATLRHRLELGVRGTLTSFRPGYDPHLSPALPHVIARVLREQGLTPEAPLYAHADVIPLSGGRLWPEALRARLPVLASISVIVAAGRPPG